jgi:hypothetical protein
MQAPDQQFFEDIRETGNEPLWDPGAYGYAIYNIKGDVHILKGIAKRYGMKATYCKATQGLGISRKNATFDK